MHLIQARLVTFQLKLEKKLTAHPGSGTLQVTFYRQTAVLRIYCNSFVSNQITLFTLFNIYTLLTISNSFFEYIEEKDKMNENISNVHDG
jgi:hypothetical protein